MHSLPVDSDSPVPSRAYNREYSAKLRADPVKREMINAQKRAMMARLAERRKEMGIQRPRSLKKEGNSVTDESREEKKSKRKDHKSYYAENRESMRRNNQRYSAKIRADPEKRAIINEKKKLAMRALKQRRLLEKQLESERSSGPDRMEFDESQSAREEEPGEVIEEEEVIIEEGHVIKDEQEVIEEVVEYIEEAPTEDVLIEFAEEELIE